AWILLPELIFTFLCELGNSPRVPSDFDNWNAALLQPLDFTANRSSDKHFFRLDM
ncbi:hypothetical protein Tco_0342340, partial [Tanacetum coccineum]